jgi:hypothetical protein
MTPEHRPDHPFRDAIGAVVLVVFAMLMVTAAASLVVDARLSTDLRKAVALHGGHQP